VLCGLTRGGFIGIVCAPLVFEVSSLYILMNYTQFMKHYEMLCVLPGTLTEEEVSVIIGRIKETIDMNGATDLLSRDLGKSRLAYPIKHIRYGYFALFRFALEPKSLSDLERAVRLLDVTLRMGIQVYDPARASDTVTLAQDPTALSVPQVEKPIRGRRNTRVETPRKERESEVDKKPADDTPTTTTGASVAKTTTKKKSSEINLENIDEKLDEILQKDIDQV